LRPYKTEGKLAKKYRKREEENALANIAPPSVLTFASMYILVTFLLGKYGPKICCPLIFLQAFASLEV
jgi:hypothetical protein